MTLIKCHYCRAQISSKAIHCPQCGMSNVIPNSDRSEYNNSVESKNKELNNVQSNISKPNKINIVPLTLILFSALLEFSLYLIDGNNQETLDGIYILIFIFFFIALLISSINLLQPGKNSFSEFLIFTISLIKTIDYFFVLP